MAFEVNQMPEEFQLKKFCISVNFTKEINFLSTWATVPPKTNLLFQASGNDELLQNEIFYSILQYSVVSSQRLLFAVLAGDVFFEEESNLTTESLAIHNN